MAEEERIVLRSIVRKYRIYPNNEQEVYFAKCFGSVRFVYNKMLAEKQEYYKETGDWQECTIRLKIREMTFSTS